MVNEEEVLMLEMDYKEQFGEEPPLPPMMVSKIAFWYVYLLRKAMDENKKLEDKDINDFIKDHHIQYDLVEGEEEDGNQN